jgi:hypothetical protein
MEKPEDDRRATRRIKLAGKADPFPLEFATEAAFID